MRCCVPAGPAALAPRLVVAVRAPARRRCALAISSARAKPPGSGGAGGVPPPPPPEQLQPALAPKPQRRREPSRQGRAPADKTGREPQGKQPRARMQPGQSLVDVNAIKQAASCQAVLTLVEQQHCGIEELTTAINRMASLHEACQRSGSGGSASGGGSTPQPAAQLEANRSAFRQLTELALQRLDEFDAYICAQLFWAAAKLQAPLTPDQQAAWEERTAQLLPEARPQSVSLIFWAYGTQQQQSGLQPGSSMLAALAEQLPRVLQHGEPQHVANSLWAWEKLGLPLNRLLAKQAAKAIQRMAASMKPQELSNTLYAFANGSWQLSSDAEAELRKQLPRALQDGKTQEVANTLWACSKLGLQPDMHLAAAAIRRAAASMNALDVSSILCACANAGWYLSSDAAAALRQQLPRVLQDGNEQVAANSLWAWTKLQLPVDGELAAAATEAVLRTAPKMAPEGVRQVSWAHRHGCWQLSAQAMEAVEAREKWLRKNNRWTE